jgi:hypothetical protein
MALGRLDPVNQQTLFTMDTKPALLNCIDKVEHLQDPLPLDEMYAIILPNPNSPHGLREYLSRRGESSLEAFHFMLAHFANNGMRTTLADNLNLTGTARFNLSIRRKLRLATADRRIQEQRGKMPAHWEGVVPYFNHSELAWINRLAVNAKAEQLPFEYVEVLPDDNGERFFSEYLEWWRSTKPQNDAQDRCLCLVCGDSTSSELARASPLAEPSPVTNMPASPTMGGTLPLLLPSPTTNISPIQNVLQQQNEPVR